MGTQRNNAWIKWALALVGLVILSIGTGLVWYGEVGATIDVHEERLERIDTIQLQDGRKLEKCCGKLDLLFQGLDQIRQEQREDMKEIRQRLP